MAVEVPAGSLYLGRDQEEEPVLYEASHLTTHGVIVGMTGSGKTGLGMIALEEALLSGIPTLVIDPKGDMGNLLLTFPDLAASDFAPWVGGDDDPAATADLWRNGLAGHGIGPDRIAKLRAETDMTIYTPGSGAGIPLNVIGSMAPPATAAGGDGSDASATETRHDEIEGLVSALLGLIGVDSDPLSGREHILLANIVDHYWTRGTPLTIASLIEAVMQPPFRKLGVMQLDTIFPAGDRTKLAMQLNGLAASPAFAAWTEGVPLDIESMLFGPDDKPRAAIVNIAHLNDSERQFVVTLLLSKVVTWMRSQPGSDGLRVLVYMDEVYGYVPPTAMPPSKKPILTLLKQARAFGVGLILSTQNPVDIDYKALSNAGTWMVGRLQTERDKARLLDGMRRSDGAVDVDELDSTISSLDKREFVLHSTRAMPVRFSTRWAMSYLAGPLSRPQIEALTDPIRDRATATAAAATGSPEAGAARTGESGATATASAPAAPQSQARELADNETTVAPPVTKTIPVRYVRADAPWGDQVGLDATGDRLRAALAIRIHMLHDDTKADLRHESEWEAIVTLDHGRPDPDDAIVVDFDDRDFVDDAPDGAVYVLPDAEIDSTPLFTKAKATFKDHLYRNETVELFANPELGLYSRIGEDRETFERRCEDAADERADEDLAKLTEAFRRAEDRAQSGIDKLEDRMREIEYDREASRNNAIAGAALDVLGGLLGGRRRTRSIGRSVLSGRKAAGKAAQRLATAENRYADALEDLDQLRAEYEEDENEIVFGWQDKAHEIESYDVGLEKTDISVDDISLVWIRG